MRATINEALSQPQPMTTIGDLQAITDRVVRIRAAIGNSVDDLTATRNRVFGAPPEVDSDTAVGCGYGDLSVLNAALDVVEHEAGRLNALANVFGRL